MISQKRRKINLFLDEISTYQGIERYNIQE